MSIRKKHNIRHYTIVEVMVAMGIFLVMMTIMMQFFTSAQKVWNLSSKRNDMYADARVAMNLMTREIQSMLYRNQDFTNDTGIYPFWFEWTERNIAPAATTPLTVADNYNVDYLTALNFIANTDLRPEDKGSDVCEIRYKFIPVYFTDATPEFVNDVRGGTLQRACTGEWLDENNEDTNWNFSAHPNNLAHTPADRVEQIWEDTDFDTVISGVYSLRFSCYMWNGGLQLIRPIDRTNGNDKDNGGFANSGILATGSVVPIAVRIDMKLLAPRDLKKLALNIYVEANGSASEQQAATREITILKQKMRTFSKVIYLGKREN